MAVIEMHSRYSRWRYVLGAEVIDRNSAFGIGVEHKLNVICARRLATIGFIVGRFHKSDRFLANVHQSFQCFCWLIGLWRRVRELCHSENKENSNIQFGTDSC